LIITLWCCNGAWGESVPKARGEDIDRPVRQSEPFEKAAVGAGSAGLFDMKALIYDWSAAIVAKMELEDGLLLANHGREDHGEEVW